MKKIGIGDYYLTKEECVDIANENAILLGYADHEEAWRAEESQLSRTMAGTMIPMILMMREMLK